MGQIELTDPFDTKHLYIEEHSPEDMLEQIMAGLISIEHSPTTNEYVFNYIDGRRVFMEPDVYLNVIKYIER